MVFRNVYTYIFWTKTKVCRVYLDFRDRTTVPTQHACIICDVQQTMLFKHLFHVHIRWYYAAITSFMFKHVTSKDLVSSIKVQKELIIKNRISLRETTTLPELTFLHICGTIATIWYDHFFRVIWKLFGKDKFLGTICHSIKFLVFVFPFLLTFEKVKKQLKK